MILANSIYTMFLRNDFPKLNLQMRMRGREGATLMRRRRNKERGCQGLVSEKLTREFVAANLRLNQLIESIFNTYFGSNLIATLSGLNMNNLSHVVDVRFHRIGRVKT